MTEDRGRRSRLDRLEESVPWRLILVAAALIGLISGFIALLGGDDEESESASDVLDRFRSDGFVSESGLAILSEVRKAGQRRWAGAIDVRPGDRVEFQLGLANLTGHRLPRILGRDSLPPNVRYVPGSCESKFGATAERPCPDTFVRGGITTRYLGPKSTLWFKIVARLPRGLGRRDIAWLQNSGNAATAGKELYQQATMYVRPSGFEASEGKRQTGLLLKNRVRTSINPSWSADVYARPGESIDFRTSLTNTRKSPIGPLVLRQTLPPFVAAPPTEAQVTKSGVRGSVAPTIKAYGLSYRTDSLRPGATVSIESASTMSTELRGLPFARSLGTAHYEHGRVWEWTRVILP